MSFDLKNMGSTYQLLMKKIFHEHLGTLCNTFLECEGYA